MSEETWKDLLAYEEPKGFKPPHWCAVLIEVTLFLVFGIGAALMRFTDWAPLNIPADFNKFCDNSTFRSALPDDYTYMHYSICIGLPFVMIVICEIERSYYSQNPNYKLFTSFQRFFYLSLRPIGMFILGIFLVSVVADYIKVQIAWPRPYFLKENTGFCENTTIFKGNLSMDERFGLTSFPCHLSSISVYTSFLAVCYTQSSVSLNSAPFIKPTIAASLFLITVSGSIYRVEISYNNWTDVVCGAVIGSLFALIVNSALLQKHKAHSLVITEAACKLLIPRVSLPVPKVALQNGNSNYRPTANIHSVYSHQTQQLRNGQAVSRSISNC